MSEFYLAHHGIKGQRWGIRRFRNYDGSLTNKGKKRYGNGGNKADGDNKTSQEKQTSTQVSPMIFTKSASKIIDATQQINQATQNISKRKQDTKQKQVDLSKMSNKELQDAITRMNLERQYRDLTKEDVTKGRQYLNDILSITGSVVAITGGALSIAIAINKLRGKG